MWPPGRKSLETPAIEQKTKQTWRTALTQYSLLDIARWSRIWFTKVTSPSCQGNVDNHSNSDTHKYHSDEYNEPPAQKTMIVENQLKKNSVYSDKF